MVYKALFFWTGLVSAQTILIISPVPGQPLAENQEVRVDFVGETPTLVSLFLNGKRVKARRNPPFQFQIRWNTELENRLRCLATYADGSTAEAERVYRALRVDVAETIKAFQCFPFLDLPKDVPTTSIRVLGGQGPLQPEIWRPAQGHLQLHLIVLLDISGSMRHLLGDVAPALQVFFKGMDVLGADSTLLTFDETPKLVPYRGNDFGNIFQTRGGSRLWDAMATALQRFGKQPRKVLLLITDGADSESRHTPDSVSSYLRQSGAALIWANPSDLTQGELRNMVARSGGFRLHLKTIQDWDTLFNRIARQHQLVLPSPAAPREIQVDQGRIWFPRTEDH